MSKKRLQAFAAGMILSTSILAGTYLISGNSKDESKNKEITEQEVQQFLVNKDEKLISSAEYDELLKLKEAAATHKQKEVEKETAKVTQKEVQQKDKPYTLTIKQGMSTGEASQILESAGMINSAKDFNAYLIEAKYHKKVRAGTFKLHSGMSFSQIANVLTK